ncbi:MAG: chemotaxis protein CheW [Pseudomonadota bacterium]
MERDKLHALVAEKDALSVYFEALLREAPPELDIETITAPAIAPVAAPVRSEGRPAWGDETFQALLFRVNGLTLAVPLVELSGVQEWEDGKVTPLPGHVPWYLGLMQYRERNVPVVDTAQLVMPEDRQANIRPWQERLRHVVFIADGTWGLACDELAEVVTLRPDEVRWRTSRTRRRWLAGTVIEHMCALLDPPVFADVLASGLEDMPDAGTQDEGE